MRFSTPGRLRRRGYRDPQAGMTLVEVMISAVVVATVALGGLTALDVSNRFTAEQQRRAEAATLAQQDQDRLRELTVAQLTGLNQARTVQLNGSTFTVTSTGQFYSAASGTTSCSQNGNADYIKTTSTVSWTGAQPGRSPVVLESLVSPQVGGSMIVSVADRNGAPVSGMTVAGSGPQALSALTGPDGCATFGGLAGGNYTVSVAQNGYVDKDGNSSPPTAQQGPVTVIVGATTTKSFQFDVAASVTTTFQTHPYPGALTCPDGSTPATGNWCPSSADGLVFANQGMSSYRNAGSGSYATQITQGSLFPFTSGYTVYAGSCPADAPSANSGTDPSVAVTPGASSAVQLTLPPIYLTVWSGTSSSPGSPVANPHVILTDWRCGGSPPSQGGFPWIEHVPATTSSGRLANPGQPYGNFILCADNGSVKSSQFITNNNLAGTTVNLYMSGAGGGRCT